MIEGITKVEGLAYMVGPAPMPLQVSAGGIIMPNYKKRKDDHTKYGRILHVGDGVIEDGKRVECKYADGDFICFSRFTAPTMLRGIEYRYVLEGDIMFTGEPKALGFEDDRSEAAE